MTDEKLSDYKKRIAASGGKAKAAKYSSQQISNMAKRISPETRKGIKQLIVQGKTNAEIADGYGISERTVTRLRKEIQQGGTGNAR